MSASYPALRPRLAEGGTKTQFRRGLRPWRSPGKISLLSRLPGSRLRTLAASRGPSPLGLRQRRHPHTLGRRSPRCMQGGTSGTGSMVRLWHALVQVLNPPDVSRRSTTEQGKTSVSCLMTFQLLFHPHPESTMSGCRAGAAPGSSSTDGPGVRPFRSSVVLYNQRARPTPRPRCGLTPTQTSTLGTSHRPNTPGRCAAPRVGH